MTTPTQAPQGATDALLPCPFCGGTSVDTSDGFAAICEDCLAEGPVPFAARGPALAAECWNRRTPAAPPEQPAPLVERGELAAEAKRLYREAIQALVEEPDLQRTRVGVYGQGLSTVIDRLAASPATEPADTHALRTARQGAMLLAVAMWRRFPEVREFIERCTGPWFVWGRIRQEWEWRSDAEIAGFDAQHPLAAIDRLAARSAEAQDDRVVAWFDPTSRHACDLYADGRLPLVLATAPAASPSTEGDEAPDRKAAYAAMALVVDPNAAISSHGLFYAGWKARWQTTQGTEAPWQRALEELAKQWDGCEWEDVPDVGATIRHDFAMHLRATQGTEGATFKQSLTVAGTEGAKQQEADAAMFDWLSRIGDFSARSVPSNPHDFEVEFEREATFRGENLRECVALAMRAGLLNRAAPAAQSKPAEPTIKILTTYAHPPVPFRGWDWVAYVEDHEDGAKGCGETEADAIRDLREQLGLEGDKPAEPSAGALPELPLGAIHNGRVHADRLEATGLECEAGPLTLCSDWVEFRRCFEHLADYALAAAQAPAVPAESAPFKLTERQVARAFGIKASDLEWRDISREMEAANAIAREIHRRAAAPTLPVAQEAKP